MKKLTAFAAVPLLLLACSRSPVATVDTYIQAHNAGDADGQLALLTQDAVFTLEGVWERSGVDALKPLFQWDAALNSMYIVHDCSGDGDLVRCLVAETNDWMALAGVDSVDFVACFQISGSRIKGIHTVLTGASELKMQGIRDEILEWARKSHSTDLDFVMPGGTWSYTAESAKKWMAITAAWREATSGTGS